MLRVSSCYRYLSTQHSRLFPESKNSDTHHNARAQLSILDALPYM
jgi:hypothetical protein